MKNPLCVSVSVAVDASDQLSMSRTSRIAIGIVALAAVCAGGGPRWVEHHGPHHDFDRLMISPAPEHPVKVLVGGHSDAAMRRAARNDGWISANCSEAEIVELVARLKGHLAEQGKEPGPDFEVNALAVDVLDADGFARLEDAGLTECQVVPWFFYGGDPKFSIEEIDVKTELKSGADLNVPLPEQNLDFHQLAVRLSEGLPRGGGAIHRAPHRQAALRQSQCTPKRWARPTCW